MFDEVGFNLYSKSVLPGFKDGISASVITGFNMGINKYIKDKDELNATIEAVKYMTSKESQKDGLEKRLLLTGIYSLYKDKEICSSEECELFEKLQSFKRPYDKTDNFDEYDEKFRHYIYDFIYKNKTASEALSDADDITKIYFVSIDTKDTYIGLISLIIIITITILMLLSFIFPFRENFTPFFNFIPLDLWFISVLGSVLILWIIYTKLGVVTSLKCHLTIILLCFGLTFNFIPILYKLISNFSGKKGFLIKINNHKYIFFLFFVLLDTLSCLLFFEPFTINVEQKIIPKGKNFQQCNKVFNNPITIIIIVIKSIIFIFISLFAFMEWNINETYYDIRYNLSSIYIDILSFLIITFFNYSNISNYIHEFIIKMSIILIVSLSNYFFIFGYKLLFANFNKYNIRTDMINSVNKNFIDDNTVDCKNSQVNSSFYAQSVTENYCTTNTFQTDKTDVSENSKSKRKSNMFSTLMDYHNQTDVDSETPGTNYNYSSTK